MGGVEVPGWGPRVTWAGASLHAGQAVGSAPEEASGELGALGGFLGRAHSPASLALSLLKLCH